MLIIDVVMKDNETKTAERKIDSHTEGQTERHIEGQPDRQKDK